MPNCDGGYSNARSLNVNSFNSWTYSNDKFGFSIQLPSFVSPTRVTEKDPNVISVNIKNYLADSLAEREAIEMGIDVLYVVVTPRNEFKEKFFLEEREYAEGEKEYSLKIKEAPDDPASSYYIGENDEYVFSIAGGHDCAVGEWCILRDSVEQIGHTFSVPENSGFIEIGTYDSPSSDLDIRRGYNYRSDPSLSN